MSRFQVHQKFVESWLGRPWCAEDGVVVPAFLKMSPALREVYEAFGNIHALTKVHNHLLPPTALRCEAGHTIFYVENQETVVWGYRDTDSLLDDPVVFQGLHSEDGWQWYSEDLPLSTWFHIMNLWQLVNGGYPAVAYAQDIAGAEASIRPLLPLEGRDAAGATKFYGVAGQLVCLSGDEASSSVWAAASTIDGLERLNEALRFDWDYSSEDD